MVRRFFRYYFMYWIASALGLFSGWLVYDISGNQLWGMTFAGIVTAFGWLLAITTEETNRWLDGQYQQR